MGLEADVLPVGDAAVLAVLGDTIDEAVVRKVWLFHAVLQRALGRSVLDIVPAYGSVLVRFNPCAVQLALVMASVRGALEATGDAQVPTPRSFDVGVCFSQEHALDLDDAAQQLGMSPQGVITEFCKPTYRVAFLGFTAGFPYLTGLPPKLNLPRLPTPRVRVPAGSIAIATGQCGIYPRTSPGGWRILGKTSATIFDPAREVAALFQRGDAVRFHAAPSLDAATASLMT